MTEFEMTSIESFLCILQFTHTIRDEQCSSMVYCTVLYITIIQVHSAANMTLAHFLLYLVKSWHSVVGQYHSGVIYVWIVLIA